MASYGGLTLTAIFRRYGVHEITDAQCGNVMLDNLHVLNAILYVA